MLCDSHCDSRRIKFMYFTTILCFYQEPKVPTTQAKSPHDTGKKSLRHRQKVPTTQAKSPYDTGKKSPRHRQKVRTTEAKSPHDTGKKSVRHRQKVNYDINNP